MRAPAGIAILIVAACGPTPNRPGDTPGDDDPEPDASTTFPDAASCGAQTENIGVVELGDPPDLLVVLDRSGSMSSPPATFPPTFTPKWTSMKNGLNAVVTAKDQQIKFGLLEFPSNDDCAGDSSVEVPVGLGSSGAFASYFNTRQPNGNTPAPIALAGALEHYNSIPVNPAGRYVLFATDGEPNCSAGDAAAETVAAVTALANAGIPTYVLGFGQFAGNTVLNDAAVAGLKPKPGATKFYEATNAAELDMALQAISGGVIVPSCSYALASVPPVPEDVTVTVNGMVVPRSPSHTDGWDYHPDAMTITFFGSYCATIMNGANTTVSFVYGCPGPVLE
jgi:hypothetical protein